MHDLSPHVPVAEFSNSYFFSRQEVEGRSYYQL